MSVLYDEESKQIPVVIGGKAIFNPGQEALDRIYGVNQFSHLANMRMVNVGFLDGPIAHGAFKCLRLMGMPSSEKLFDVVHRMFTIPNSQVKNFLCAARTYFGGLGKARILIRGSTSGAGSGAWVALYGTLLLTQDTDVEIVCYDYSEVEGTETFEFEKRKLQIFHKVGGIQNSQGYDVLIDDAWLPGQGPQPIVPKTKFWSLKGEGDKVFLHSTERRAFSSGPAVFKPECKCMVCTVCGECVQDYDSYKLLRMSLAGLGHVPDCIKMGVLLSDLIKKNEVKKQLLTMPIVQLFKPAQFRAVIALKDEIPIVAVSSNEFVKKGVIKELQVKHKGPVKVTKCDDVSFSWLKGKKIGFVGVMATILGSTQIQAMPAGATGIRKAEIVFYGNKSSVDANPSALTIYVPGPFQRSGWEKGARSVGDYREYKWNPVPFLNPRHGYYIHREGKIIRRPALKGMPSVRDLDEAANGVELSEMRESVSVVYKWSYMVQNDGWVELRDPKTVPSKDWRHMVFRDIKGHYGVVNSEMWDRTLSVMFKGDESVVPSRLYVPKDLLGEEPDLYWYIRHMYGLKHHVVSCVDQVYRLGMPERVEYLLTQNGLNGSPWKIRCVDSTIVRGQISDVEILLSPVVSADNIKEFERARGWLSTMLMRYHASVVDDHDEEEGCYEDD